MSKNNDFDNEHRRPELDEYLSKEITQYYGEDVINNIKSSSAPPPPILRRKNRILSAVGICCAVIFLTGAAMFSGVFLTSGIPALSENDRDTTSSTTITESDSDIPNSSDNSTDTEIYISTDTVSSDNISGENIFSDIEIDTDTSQETNIDTDTDKNILSESDIETNTDNISSANDVSSDNKTVDYFSLPEYPDEGYISEIETDVYNNSSTNPYDNVTTGRQVRAGVGISLMILALITAFILNKTKSDTE